MFKISARLCRSIFSSYGPYVSILSWDNYTSAMFSADHASIEISAFATDESFETGRNDFDGSYPNTQACG